MHLSGVYNVQPVAHLNIETFSEHTTITVPTDNIFQRRTVFYFCATCTDNSILKPEVVCKPEVV